MSSAAWGLLGTVVGAVAAEVALWFWRDRLFRWFDRLFRRR